MIDFLLEGVNVTIAISLKVNDGVVLASDSAATMMSSNGGVLNVYENANKIFNLQKGSPIGAATWGAGSIDMASIATLAKDFRRVLTEGSDEHPDWKMQFDCVSVEEVARRFKIFMYDERYVEAYCKTEGEKPPLGFVVAGYSPKESFAEEWLILIDDKGICTGPTRIRGPKETGWYCNGDPEAIYRLVLGFDPRLLEIFVQLGVAKKDISNLIRFLKEQLEILMVVPPMPIQDAIDLAEFLVETTIKYRRFLPGAPIVGGPVEIAVITKHEGFKWVKRKHYYDSELNP